MGLLGQPSEKLIQSFRDAVQVITTEGSLTIGPEQLQSYWLKPDSFPDTVQVTVDPILRTKNPPSLATISSEPSCP